MEERGINITYHSRINRNFAVSYLKRICSPANTRFLMLKSPAIDKIPRLVSMLFLAFLVIFLVFQAYNSLHWRLELDTPILQYSAFLIDRFDLVPYRDFFETSMPGTFAFHALVGTLFGYSDLAFHVVDLVLLLVFLLCAAVFMSRFGWLTAAWGVVLFALVYFGKGQTMTLQRDYLGLFPLVFALLLIPTTTDRPVHWWRFALTGFLFGLASLVKPHLAIGLPAFWGILYLFHRQSGATKIKPFLQSALLSAAGFIIPIAAAMLWLAQNAALRPFLEILFEHIPLYSSLNGAHVSLTPAERIHYLLLMSPRLGNYPGFALCLAYVVFIVFRLKLFQRPQRLTIFFLAVTSALYALYPILAGKFWSYHYMPFSFFICLSTGLCFFIASTPTTGNQILIKIIPLLLLITASIVELKIPVSVTTALADARSGYTAHAPKDGRVDELASWLTGNLAPGDTIQPLDWTGGSVHAMLLSEARLATHFLYDYPFYIHVSSDYTRLLRQQFIRQLGESRPRFIIEVTTHKPWVSGVDTTREFPELSHILEENYAVVHSGDGYQVYQLNADNTWK